MEGYSFTIPHFNLSGMNDVRLPRLQVKGPKTRIDRVPRFGFDIGVTTVTYTVTDVNNETNTASCQFNVTVSPGELNMECFCVCADAMHA